MYEQAERRTRGKVTWSGCGQHVDGVLRPVPELQRCSCGGPGQVARFEVEQGGCWSHRLLRR